MGNKEFSSLCRESRREAERNGDLEQWCTSHKLNIACKDAVEEAIRRDFDGMYLKADCAESIIKEYGFHRTAFVLANSLQQKDSDGRFSRENKAWAKQTFIAPDKDSTGSDRRRLYAVDSHPAVLDGFVNQFRKCYQALGMFDGTHCQPESRSQDYTGKVLVFSADSIKESCLSPQNQLWLAQSGFGCRPTSSGRAVYATCLGDGERARFDRSDFVGVLKEELLPEWAAQKLDELKQSEQTAMGGMTMQ